MNILNLIASVGCFSTLVWAFKGRTDVLQFSKHRKVAFAIALLFCLFMAAVNALTSIVSVGAVVAIPVIILGVATAWAIIYRKGW